MKANQVGWYWLLLMEAWLSTETPQATLPNDEVVLKKLSRYKQTVDDLRQMLTEVETNLTVALNVALTDVNHDAIAEIVGKAINTVLKKRLEELELQFGAVIQQFEKTKDQNLIYNERQIKELKKWVESYNRRQDIGLKGAQARWKDVDVSLSQELRSPEITEPHPLLNGLTITNHGLTKESHGATILRTNLDSVDVNLESPTPIEYVDSNEVLPIMEQPNVAMGQPLVGSLLNSTIYKERSTELNDSTTNTVEVKKTLLRRKSESLFDEDKFSRNSDMLAHDVEKYPEFVKGDWDYLVGEFKNIFYGKKKASWKRTWYTFVANQIRLYKYRPGDYDWRESHARREGNQVRPNSGSSKNYESATERHQRLEREGDEFIQRLLQGDNSRDNQEDSEALPLTSDDIRDS